MNWTIFGFIAQGLMGSRFFVQWVMSEKAKRVLIPDVFWIISIAGAGLSLIYAIHIRDVVFSVSLGCGLLIYIRNLYMSLGRKR